MDDADKGKEEALGTVEESLPELGLDERGGEDPGDGTGQVLLDHGMPAGFPFDVAYMKEYGASQRGAIAPKQIQAGAAILHEPAHMWVATAPPITEEDAPAWEREANADYTRYFLGLGRKISPPYPVCPPELSAPAFPSGGLHVALTGLLIRDKEDVAELVIGDSEWALHGSLDLGNFPAPQDCYEVAKALYFADKADRWDVKRFGRLFGVMQVNAIRGVLPFSDRCYGLGLFGSAAFINHSCQPNAVLIVQPNQVYLRALSLIEAGDEITIAYQELPLELLTPAMVRGLHMRSGAVVNQLGCRCEVCRIHLEDEAEALKEAGRDPNEGREVVLNLEEMFEEHTSQRLRLDERLRTYVSAMMNDRDGEEGMHASNGMRMYYEHYLTPPTNAPVLQPETEEEDAAPPSDFCPDLAYVLAEIYCRCIIHYPGQEADNYLFWTALFHDLLRKTVINMPKTLCDALGARCYAAMLICARIPRDDATGQRVTLGLFMESWLMLRTVHASIYKTLAFLVTVCRAYPNISHVVTTYHDYIARKEMQIQIAAALDNTSEKAALVQEEAPLQDDDDVLQGCARGPPSLSRERDLQRDADGVLIIDETGGWRDMLTDAQTIPPLDADE